MPYASLRLAALAIGGALVAAATAGDALARDAGPDAALSAAAPDARSWPFLGRWELDLTRMPSSYGPSPRRVLFSFRYAGAGMWRTTIDITAPDGSVRQAAVQYRRDGRAFAGEGDRSEADHAAFLSPTPNVLVMNLAKDRSQGSVRVYTVSGDGSEMTESAAAIDGQGAPYVRTFHFRRLP